MLITIQGTYMYDQSLIISEKMLLMWENKRIGPAVYV